MKESFLFSELDGAPRAPGAARPPASDYGHGHFADHGTPGRSGDDTGCGHGGSHSRSKKTPFTSSRRRRVHPQISAEGESWKVESAKRRKFSRNKMTRKTLREVFHYGDPCAELDYGIFVLVATASMFGMRYDFCLRLELIAKGNTCRGGVSVLRERIDVLE